MEGLFKIHTLSDIEGFRGVAACQIIDVDQALLRTVARIEVKIDVVVLSQGLEVDLSPGLLRKMRAYLTLISCGLIHSGVGHDGITVDSRDDSVYLKGYRCACRQSLAEVYPEARPAEISLHKSDHPVSADVFFGSRNLFICVGHTLDSVHRTIDEISRLGMCTLRNIAYLIFVLKARPESYVKLDRIRDNGLCG